MIPLNLTLTITPIVPVKFKPNWFAILRALKSSRITVQSGVSNAKAIALDSAYQFAFPIIVSGTYR